MEIILSRCGFRCDLCLAYRPNIEAEPANRQILSDGWHRYFGFRIPPERIACDGCMAESPTLDSGCPVRPCAIERGVGNCAQCGEYVCGRLKERLIAYEDIQARIGAAIPPQDRARFIYPFENKRRLDALRQAADEES